MKSKFIATVITGSIISLGTSMFAANESSSNNMNNQPIGLQTSTVVKDQVVKPQITCPVLGAKIDKNIYFDYQGKRIYACCSSCIDVIKKDPSKYVKKFESQGVTLAKASETQVSGKQNVKEHSWSDEKCFPIEQQ